MTLQVYAFVYQRLMDFPQRRFDYETLATNELFDLVRKMINVKTYLHHSHITGKKIGYAHDFWKTKVRENKDFLTFIAHIFFGFDMFFLIKGIKLSVRETKDISISRTGLRNIIYASIGNIKFINKMKYFLTSLG